MNKFVILLFTLFLFVATTLAQTTNGTVRGRVVDVLGAIIIGADVTITSSEGAERKAQTNQSGEFIFNLPAGRYTARVSNRGFALYENTEINVIIICQFRVNYSK